MPGRVDVGFLPTGQTPRVHQARSVVMGGGEGALRMTVRSLFGANMQTFSDPCRQYRI